ncbi:BCD family MFS transporter [Sphingomonas sp. PAMC 26617]|uniref:BCD family MFS transporter n=1 Tax=Sphingomonas sp. PAMC 26617 TaxID=1112216 RepID=UPI00028991D1|nr:BCD family MFS transporter [Sphingomonas sp. PAMC 26617]
MNRAPVDEPLGWLGIVRLGLVQSAIGAIVMLATSLLNRVMVVEYALPAAVPAGLVAWHYAVQLSRPAWGHGSDRGNRRTPWIIGGMALLAGGALAATWALGIIAGGSVWGYALAVVAFAAIGAGVGAAGTSLLALLATRVAPARRAAAAAVTWIMMVFGIAVSAAVAGALVDPFSFVRLVAVVAGVAGVAFLVATLGIWGIERGAAAPVDRARAPAPQFRVALGAIWADRDMRRFTVFVFLSMLAYSMQDLILEPFTGLRFGLTPGQSTQVSSVQHGGVLLGMILAGLAGSAFGAQSATGLRHWIFGGCVGSAVALAGLALAALVGPGWPVLANIFALGFANGIFAVSAIGAMMALAGGGTGAAPGADAGLRMGVWGAAQAIAFGLGGLGGAVAVDGMRGATGSVPESFMLVFALEALLFLCAAALALRAQPQAEHFGREVTL